MNKLLMAVLIVLLLGIGYLIGANGNGRYAQIKGEPLLRYDTRRGTLDEYDINRGEWFDLFKFYQGINNEKKHH